MPTTARVSERRSRFCSISGARSREYLRRSRTNSIRPLVRFLAREVSTDTYLNIMVQYHPCYKAYEIPPLARPVSESEFSEAIALARQQGLSRLDKQ